MKSVTVYSDDEENLALVQALANKMGLTTERSGHQPSTTGEAMAQVLEELAAQDTVAEAIPDPAAWQREIRQDRELPGRS